MPEAPGTAQRLGQRRRLHARRPPRGRRHDADDRDLGRGDRGRDRIPSTAARAAPPTASPSRPTADGWPSRNRRGPASASWRYHRLGTEAIPGVYGGCRHWASFQRTTGRSVPGETANFLPSFEMASEPLTFISSDSNRPTSSQGFLHDGDETAEGLIVESRGDGDPTSAGKDQFEAGLGGRSGRRGRIGKDGDG